MQGDLKKVGYTRGTSNSAALATNSAQTIHNHLTALAEQGYKPIPTHYFPVIIKAMMVHSAKQPATVRQEIASSISNFTNKKAASKDIARYLGYGYVDLNWLFRNTQQKATVLGWGEIRSKEIHEYRFPLPVALSKRKDWRKIVITLAWLSPINTNHTNYREAKLELITSGTKWQETPLKLERTEQDHHRVKKGTVQHEILESEKEITAYQDGEDLVLQVECKPDAISHLDESITYALAVTLEVKQETQLQIYQQIKQRISTQVRTQVR